MLSARTRNVLQRAVRNFATVVDTSGVKVAAVDFGAPSSAVTVLLKAGSRYQNKEGLANVLKNFAFKSTANRSAIGTVREAELYGGLLTASLTREHLALTAEFLRGDESFFVDVLSSFVTSARFTRHELEEYVKPLVAFDTQAAAEDPVTRALEAAHALAFRSGLGSSLFAPTHADQITANDVKEFASTAFANGNIAVIGTNIDPSTLSKLVEQGFSSASTSTSSSTSTTPASKYFGGETRLEGNGGLETVFIGFGNTGSASAAEVATLAAHLSTTPSIKWSKGSSPIAAVIPEDASVQTVFLPYSDASLFGLLVQAPTTEVANEAAKKATEVLKNVVVNGLKGEELKGAVARAKFATANAAESREGLINALGSKIFAGEASLESTLAAFDKVNSASFNQAVASLIAAKPTLVVVGDALKLPHADELGF